MNIPDDGSEDSGPFALPDRAAGRPFRPESLLPMALPASIATLLLISMLGDLSGPFRWQLASLSAISAVMMIILSQVAVWLAWGVFAPQAPRGAESPGLPRRGPGAPLWDRELDG